MNSSDELYVYYFFYCNFCFIEVFYKEILYLKLVKLICYYVIEVDIKLSWLGCVFYKFGLSLI